MAQLSALLDRVHDELPAVPEALALRALSDAAKEFCSRTHAWQETLPRTRLRENIASYELYPDQGVQIAALKDVRMDDTKLHPAPTEASRLRAVSARAGTPTHYSQWGPGVITLNRPPREAGAALTVVAALTLALGAVDTELPATLLDEYGEAIAMGAKMRLVRMNGQPWYSPDAVIGYAGPYYTAITAAKARTMSALGEADMQIEMRSWA